MRLLTLTWALACTLLAASLALAGSPELVRNGGAEEGLDYWTAVVEGEIAQVNGYPLRGELSFLLTARPCSSGLCMDGLEQALETIPGQEYELSFFIEGRVRLTIWNRSYLQNPTDLPNMPLVLGIDVNGDGLFTADEEHEYASLDFIHWGRVVETFTPQSAVTKIRFIPKRVSAPPSWLVIAWWSLDEVSTVKVRTFADQWGSR